MLENLSAEDFLSGQIIPVDKPLHWTSYNLVKKIKILIQKKLKIKKIKVGHAGTLDPLASGLVIICTGKATKKIEEIQALEKEYIATIRLGATTPSYDLETAIDAEFDISHVTRERIEEVLNSFIGETDQVPPVFSAVSVDGKRAYEYARKGQELVLQSKKIMIKEIEIQELALPTIKLRILCGKGTYIRSLAHDIGEKLQCGAHLTGLVRTANGGYTLDLAYKIETLENIFTNN